MRGPDVWKYVYRDSEGQHSRHIGTVEKYPTKASAWKRAKKFQDEVNGQREHVWVRDVLTKYEKEDMLVRQGTAASYRSNIKRIRERYGDTRLDVMARDMMGVEQWVNGSTTIPTSTKPARPLAKKSKVNLKALVHRIIERAIFWGLLDVQRNPMGLVKVSGRSGRTRPLVEVSIEQYQAMIDDPKFATHARMMVMIAMVLGFRASEILALQEEAFSYERKTFKVQRSVVGKHESDTKTPESTKEVPIHEDLAEEIRVYIEQNPPVEGWLFGNPITKRPYHRDSLLEDHIEPAGRRAGCPGIGWHSFRHNYRTMLAELEEPLEVQQKMMRHAQIATTMSYGDQKIERKRRQANDKVYEMVRRQA